MICMIVDVSVERVAWPRENSRFARESFRRLISTGGATFSTILVFFVEQLRYLSDIVFILIVCSF